jgi:hypothetical protein
MITGLKVTGTVYPYKYIGSSKQTGVKTGVGYKRYIHNHSSDGPLTDVECRAFLNMWLCRFIFCGKTNEPTLNHIVMAEDLAAGTPIPLEAPSRKCLPYAPSNHLSDAHQQKDPLRQWPLVVSSDVVAIIHAPDCCH